MIKLFKTSYQPTTSPQEASSAPSSLHQIPSSLPLDTFPFRTWLSIYKKWQKLCSLNSTASLELYHKRFTSSDYHNLLKDLLQFSKSHSLHHQVKRFEFRFEGHDHRLRINFSIFENLFKQAFPHLETLSLSFINVQTTIHQDIHTLMMAIGRQLTRLKELKLNFEGCSLWDANMVMFGSNQTGNYLKITHLDLNLTNCSHIKNKGFDSLFHSFTRALSKLTKLKLSFSKTRMDDINLEKLMSLINKRLAHLEALELDFTGCKNIRGFSLSSSRDDFGPKLTKLSLIFDMCINFGNEGLSAVTCLASKHQETMKSFYLSLTKCENITDTGIEIFSEGFLKTSKNLKEVVLDLGMCSKITDKGLENISCGIGGLEGLQKLQINLFACNKISDKGVRILGEEIQKKLKSLVDLNLDFLYVNNVSKMMLNNLVAMFDGIKKHSINFI